MLTSLAAATQPLSAPSASSLTSPASLVPRSSNEGKNGKSGRICPSRQQPSISDWPGAAACADSGKSDRPRPKADRPGGPSVTVRWPPTTGTSYRPEAQRMPSSTRRMTSRGPVTVSTRASGQAPMAARSLTLVLTAATPAP